jgi:hypothetical protein
LFDLQNATTGDLQYGYLAEGMRAWKSFPVPGSSDARPSSLSRRMAAKRGAGQLEGPLA